MITRIFARCAWRSTDAGQSPRHRLWWCYHTMFVLLALHVTVFYIAPDYMYRSAQVVRDWRSGFGAVPAGGHFDPQIFEGGGKRWLWGGDGRSQHFDITEFRLNVDQFHHGLGREAFPALIEPAFATAGNEGTTLDDEDPVLLLTIGDDVRVYPIQLLTRHEVVNDVVGGVPVFAAYCILADLGAVYDRRMGDHTLTFALSGYTYADPDIWNGTKAFVLWDRETESLWWPVIHKAVSGPLIDAPLRMLDERLWRRTTWGEVRARHPDAPILVAGQDFEPPGNWPRLKIDRPRVP